jgi:hypothetical protein
LWKNASLLPNSPLSIPILRMGASGPGQVRWAPQVHGSGQVIFYLLGFLEDLRWICTSCGWGRRGCQPRFLLHVHATPFCLSLCVCVSLSLALSLLFVSHYNFSVLSYILSHVVCPSVRRDVPRQNRSVRPMTFRGRIGLSVRRCSAAEPALKFEVLSVGFQDLNRQRDMVFFFFFFFALNCRRCCSENFRIWFSRHGFQDLGSQLWGLGLGYGFQDMVFEISTFGAGKS